MGSYYQVLDIEEVNNQKELNSFTIKYCYFCHLIGPFFGLAVYIVIMIFVILNPSVGLAAIVRLLFIAIFTPIVFMFFRYAIRNGSLVLNADTTGIIYRMLGDKSKYIRIEWKWINAVSIFDDGATTLRLCTSIRKDVDIPRPCNGSVSHQSSDGCNCLLFYPGITSGKLTISSHLNRLKSLSGA